MLSAARQQVEIMEINKKNMQRKAKLMDELQTFVTAAPTPTYVQDPNTGQVYLMPIPSYSAAAFPKQPLQSHLSAVPRMPNMDMSCIHSAIRAPPYFPLQQAGFTNQQMFMQPQLSNVATQSFNTALMSCMPSQVSPLVSMPTPITPTIMNQLTPALSPTSFTTPPLLQQFSTQQPQQQQQPNQQQSQTPITQQPLTQTSITQTSITQTPITQPQMTQPQSNIQKPPIMTPKLSSSARYTPY